MNNMNAASLHAKLLNIARKEGIEFQLLLNRLGAEQFLARLSQSPFANQFIFKGGALLAYLIDTDRKTKDLDFTLNKLSNQVEEITAIIQSVLKIPMDDCVDWGDTKGSPLTHPDMPSPGVITICHFLIGKMRGHVQIDMAIGEVQEAILTPLKKIRYKNETLMGEDFSILSYPRELIFAEKLEIALKKAEDNTRLRDFYDMFKLMENELDSNLLKSCLTSVFAKRGTEIIPEFILSDKAITKLQGYWEAYITKAKLKMAPKKVKTIISAINAQLKEIFR